MNIADTAFPTQSDALAERHVCAFAPYRVSFVGGGTDLPEFFNHDRGSVVSVSLSIGVSVYASHSPHAQHNNILTCDEHVRDVDPGKIQNHLLRACLKEFGAGRFTKMVALGDLQHGSGMGSSGSFAVALLLALSKLFRQPLLALELAELAYKIERYDLGEKVGKQDQYAAAFGGLNHISFDQNEVDVRPISISTSNLSYLQDNLMLLATGNRRKAGAILREMSQQLRARKHSLIEMRDLADELAVLLSKPSFDVSELGRIMNMNWELKRGLSQQISNSSIDAMHEVASAHGALGAKLLGAGSGGYMLILAPPDRQAEIKEALGHPIEQPCVFGTRGASLSELAWQEPPKSLHSQTADR